MLFAVEPTAGPSSGVGSSVVEATAEQRGLLAELLGIRIETHAAGGAIGLGARLVEFLRRNRDVFRGRFGAGPIPPDELDETERRLSDAAAAAGVRIAFAAGSGAARSRGELHLVGRDRPEVRAAADAVSSDPRWLYPALLALTDGELPDLDAVRASWLTALEEGAPRSGSVNRGS
jgi:hypothetical protein